MSIGERLNISNVNSDQSFDNKTIKNFKEDKLLKALKAQIWVSKKGRAGKIVSIIKFECPKYYQFDELHYKELNELLKKMKKLFSCGGTFKDNELVIQFNNREKIKSFLLNHGIESKICGG